MLNEQFEVIATMLGKQLPKVAQMLREAKDDLLAFTAFPVSHWKKILSTNPLERFKEVKRRTDVVGVFPTDLLFHLVAGAVCWFRTSRRHVSRHPGLMSPEIPE